MRIIDAQPGDAMELTAIAIAAKHHWGYPELWMEHWRETLTITPELIASCPTRVALVETGIVGFYVLRLAPSVVWLEHLWVLPRAMKSGIGRQLFLHAETVARACGADELRIESDPHAEGFYRRMGAETLSRIPAHMEGNERFLPLMTKALK